jgi:uncharacterized protein DUF4192
VFSVHRPARQLDPGGLIASLPALIGFHPTGSVLVIGFTSTTTRLTAECVLRVDIPAPGERAAICEQLSTALIKQEIDLVAVVVIAEPAVPGGPVPHREVADLLLDAFHQAHVEVAEALWAARIEAGVPWRCYVDPARTGLVSDPPTVPVTAAAVLAGQPIYASRADLADRLAADPAPVLARRARQLAALPSVQPDQAVALLDRAIDQTNASSAQAVLDEDTVVGLAHALTHPAVREAGLRCALSDRAGAAVAVWTVLTRRAPRAVVAHPASLLATGVYLLGDGVLANLALDIALAADPNHPLAGVVRICLDNVIRPDQFRALLVASIQAAEVGSATEMSA